MNTGGAILIIIALLTACGAVIAADSTGVDTACYQVINTPEQAVARALKFTGFSEAEGVNAEQVRNSAHLMTFVDAVTPFLHDSMNGRQVWSVTFEDLVWNIGKAKAELWDKYHKQVEVILDQETGRLFKIRAVTVGDKLDDSCCQKPSARSAEIQMFRKGRQRYHGFPDMDPEISFRRALEATLSGYQTAKEIVALYILYSDMEREPRATWDIHIYGLPPVPARVPNIPVNQRNHWRNFVNPVTGESEGSINCPHPLEVEE